MDNTDTNSSLDYTQIGFDSFLNRSIDFTGVSYPTLSTVPPVNTGMQVNYDQNQITGSLGDRLQIGNITIDGSSGRISIFDDSGNELVRLGAL